MVEHRRLGNSITDSLFRTKYPSVHRQGLPQNMQRADKKLSAVLKRIHATNANLDELVQLDVVRKLCPKKNFAVKQKHVVGLLIAVVGLLLYSAGWFDSTSECIIKMPREAPKIFRKPENCDMCLGITEVDRVQNISPSQFEEFYAHTGKPVVISDGTKDWSAIHTFSFDFLKEIYQQDGIEFDTDDCQFFPYKTEFKSLSEVFNMSRDRSMLKEGTDPWYVGWSNCNDEAGKMLRDHYSRPYFLPDNSENIALSWIFMGGPGFGAHMHVDNVEFPSWQAQISGKKRWRLMPPPECVYQCHELSVTVQPAEIIVVDTNRWYHQTFVLDGNISITIGSEFD